MIEIQPKNINSFIFSKSNTFNQKEIISTLSLYLNWSKRGERKEQMLYKKQVFTDQVADSHTSKVNVKHLLDK